jgi:8-oxo-dGTP pyrophosphatase MutT (NUDIX family)
MRPGPLRFGQNVKKIDKPQTASQAVMTQYAALCFRHKAKHAPEILLITSRDTGRWVVPKGWPMKGKSGGECAAQEAFEEAGVEGRLISHSVGFFTYDKILDDGTAQPCVVSVYPVAVEKLHAIYPEHGQRRRRWFSPAKAASQVAEPELATILAGFDPAKLPRRPAGKA